MSGYFDAIAPVKFDPEAEGLAFRHYNPDEVVLGKRMEDHLRFAVAYWHSFCWEGGDPFGGQTFERPWFPADTMALAEARAKAQGIAQETRDRLQEETERQRVSIEARLAEKIADAEKQIAATRDAALQNVRTVAVDVADTIVTRLLGESDRGAAERAVDRELA